MIAKRLQAFKFELIPTGEQKREMRRFAGARRYVYNRALELQQKRFEAGENKLSYASLCKEVTQWRNDPATPWLADVHSQVLQQALKDLETAYANFFEKRADAPTFKKKGRGESFRYPQLKQAALDAENGRINLPLFGWLRYRKSRDVPGELRSVTVSLRAGRWYVSILTRRDVEVPVHQGDAAGIDMGVKRFAALSDGSHIEPLNSFKRHEEALAKAQRRMSRKVKFSNNWKRAKARLQTIHHRIANARHDFLHKASATISKNHALVVMEDLQVGNMSKSAAGTTDAPGRNVRAKSGLNKAILDQGWYEFRRQVEYKTAWNGGFLVLVPPHHTSQECPCCHHVSPDNRKTQEKFLCVSCGFEANADHVGAINVLSRWSERDERQDTADASAGRATAAEIAWQVSRARGGQQQEPTEETVSE